MVKFLQTGDLHLGANFASSALSGRKARKRRQELLDTFKEIIDYGSKAEVDLILISGDLFELKYANKALLKYITGILSTAAPIPVLISPGNHDPVVKNSYYLSYEWPDNVNIFLKEEWEKFAFEEPAVNVYGLGWQRRSINEPLLQRLKIDDKEELNIILLHGDILTATNSYLPIDKSVIPFIGGDYYALGHIHQRQVMEISHKLKAVYAGSPEPLDINETGEHGFYLGELDKSGVELEFISVARRNCFQKVINLNESDTFARIRHKIKEELEDEEYIYRIILEGRIDPELDLDLNLLQDEMEDRAFHVELIDKTLPQYDLEGLKAHHRDNAIGLFIKVMEDNLKEASGKEREEMEKALYYGIDALLGKKVIFR